MMDPRLQELIRELFVADEASTKLFSGELLDSLEISEAQLAVSEGLPIPASSYTQFDSFVRRLRPDPARTTKLHNFDVYLAATLARLISTRDHFFVALWRDHSAGGPHITFSKKSDFYEVTLMSNYRMLERRENWFAAALSLFEWYAADTDELGIKLFRKKWSLDNDPVEIASAVSLVVTYVLDALASGATHIQIPRLQDEVLDEQMRRGQLWPVLDDCSIANKLYNSEISRTFTPPLSQYRAGMDSLISQHNLRDAIDIAAENDDELGMYSLEQLLEDVEKREALFKPVLEKLTEFVSLSAGIRSIRLLPRDHPAYEDPEDYEDEDYEDYEEEEAEPPVQPVGAVPVPVADPEPAAAPTPEITRERLIEELPGLEKLLPPEPIIYPGYTRINPGDSTRLWELLSVFDGKVKPSKATEFDAEFLVVSLFGSYLREITGFDKLHDPKLFAPAFDAREKKNGPPVHEEVLGVPGPTILTHSGVQPGIVAELQHRAAKVFETLLKLKALGELNSRLMFINELPDDVLKDCKVWSMLKNKGNARMDQQRTLETFITTLASLPTM